MEEGGPRDVGDGGAHLLPRVNHVHPEGVDGVAADVVAVHARDEHLALVVVNEEAADHGAGHQIDRGGALLPVLTLLPPSFSRVLMCQLISCLCQAEPDTTRGKVH